MPKVIFETNLKEDARNLVETVNFSAGGKDFGAGIEPEVIDIVKNNSKEEAVSMLTKKLSEYYEKNKDIIQNKIKEFEKAWFKINDRFFKRLSEVTKKPVCSQKFTACITTAGRCPYNPDKFWFMIPLFGEPERVNLAIAHEILHMQVINNYRKEIELPDKPKVDVWYWNLIESLTFLLNEEFSDLLIKQDKGYSAHQKLRVQLLEEWRKNKDFEKFLPNAVEIAKATTG